MKRIAFLMFMVVMSLSASAASIRYFTESQAARTVKHLNAQNEIMIYCGYEYEIETYVLVNEVWAERVNSAYYEIWIFGYDAYTGEEVYMPLDLECVWLYSAGRMYNAAQYLRFNTSIRRPALTWYVPPYNHYVRVPHQPGYHYTYHYDVHRRGWMPPADPHRYGHGSIHIYYCRQPNVPAPRPVAVWTPGVERPQLSNASVRPSGNERNNGTTPSARPSTSQSSTTGRNSGAAVSGTSSMRSNSGSNTSTTNTRANNNTVTPSTRSNSGSTTGTTNTRSTNNSSTATPSTRSNSGSTTGATNTRSTNNSSTATPSTRSNSGSSTGTTNTRSTNNSSTATPNTRSNSGSSTGTTNTRSTNNSSTATPSTRSNSGSSTGTTSKRSNSSATSATNTKSNSSSNNRSNTSRSTSSSRNNTTNTRTR